MVHPIRPPSTSRHGRSPERPLTALTHYRVSEKRGAIPTTLAGGIIVHDHFKPYYTLPDVEHALCNAHHLRELKALIEIEKEPWAKKMFRLLLKANKAVRGAVAHGASVLAERVKRRILDPMGRWIAIGTPAECGCNHPLWRGSCKLDLTNLKRRAPSVVILARFSFQWNSVAQAG